jgi:hypothetical protein
MEIVPLPPDDNRKPEVSQSANGQRRRAATERVHYAAGVWRNPQHAQRLPYGYDKPPKEEAFNLRDFLRKIWRRKWLVLAIVSVVTTLTALRVSQAKNVYQSTPPSRSVVRTPCWAKTAGLLLLWCDDQEIKTAIFLLSSTPLLEDVVVSLKLDQNPSFSK